MSSAACTPRAVDTGPDADRGVRTPTNRSSALISFALELRTALAAAQGSHSPVQVPV